MVTRVESNSEARQYLAKLRAQAWGNGVAGATDEAAAKVAFKQLSTLIASDSGLRVTSTAGNRANEVGQIVGGTGIPEIDNPASAKNVHENLEKLLLELQLDNDERMAKMAQDRLEGEKAALQARHADMSAQIKKNIEAIDDAVQKQNFSRIFGWVMFSVSAVITVASCGAAIGAAVAASAAAAATTAAATTAAATTATTAAATTTTAAAAEMASIQAAAEMAKAAAQEAVKAAVRSCLKNALSLGLSTTMQVAQENGDMEKWTKSLAGKVRSLTGTSKAKAEMWAQIILGVALMAASMGMGISGAKDASLASASAVKAGKHAADAGVRTARTLAGTIAEKATQFSSSRFGRAAMISLGVGMSAGSAVGQGLSINAQYKAGMTQAETKDIQTALKLIEQMIAETQEEIEQILEQEQALMSKLFAIVNSEMETEDEISKNLGSMA